MYERVTVFASDAEASLRFYSTVLPEIGMEGWRTFAVAPAPSADAVTRRLHIGFRAPSRSAVDAFWRAGVDAGYRSDGEPGLRPQYSDDYYGAFLLDPDGNNTEAMLDGTDQGDAEIDHLWIRVRDVPAAQRFYEELAPAAGLRLGTVALPERVHFRGRVSSFALVAGEPTSRLRMDFPAAAGVEPFERRDPDGNAVAVVRAS